MPKIARGDETETVNTNHGCDATTTSNACSNNVFANSIGVVRKDDHNTPHLKDPVPCTTHSVAMSSNMSPNVFVNSKNVAFLGSGYGGEVITTGSSNVFVNGS